MGIAFEILYDENPCGMYFTGQIVKGRATIKVDEQIPFKGIQLHVRGYAKVRWDESSAGKTSDIHFDEEKYFDAITDCIDTKGLELTLEAGTYTYTFECILPSECPSSFEGLFGRIRYDTKIVVVRPRAFNKTYSMGFSVLQIFDLNQLPQLRIPAKMEEYKTFCCGPCKSRPLVLSLDIPRTSYVPGELVHFNARLVNTSSTEVEQVRITLNLVALYSVRTRIRTKTEKIAIAKKKFGAFEKSILEFNDRFQVPPTPPTCEGLCQIIKITYEVAVTVKVKGAHINPFVAIPVVIGNVPFVDKSSNEIEMTLIENLRSGRASGLVTESDVQIPPPSYEEAFFGQNMLRNEATIENKNETTHTSSGKFIPRYPFYSGGVFGVAPDEAKDRNISNSM